MRLSTYFHWKCTHSASISWSSNSITTYQCWVDFHNLNALFSKVEAIENQIKTLKCQHLLCHSWNPLHCHRKPFCESKYLRIICCRRRNALAEIFPFVMPGKFYCVLQNHPRALWVNFRVTQSFTRTDWSFLFPPQGSSRFARIETNFINQSDTWSMRVEWMELYRAVKQGTLSALFPISWTRCLLYSFVVNSRRLGKVFLSLLHPHRKQSANVEWQMLARFFFRNFSLITVCLCAIESMIFFLFCKVTIE